MSLFAALLIAASAGAAVTPHWHLTVDGVGPVRIGMSPNQAARALRTELTGNAIARGQVCVERQAGSLPGVTFMFENGKLTRISVEKPSPITTPRGIRPGSTAGQVRKAYGPRLEIYSAKYLPPPAQDLTYWIVPNKRGVRFETGADRRVSVMHAGSGSIIYVEGCG